MMTLRQLASLIAKREGKKSQVKIGDVREVLKILVDLEVEFYEMPEDAPSATICGAAHAKKNKKKPKK